MPNDNDMNDDHINDESPQQHEKEQRILRMVKKVLTDVAKDTVTPAELKHPLSENTIHGIRECLALITSREVEIQQSTGQPNSSRPHFIDEPQTHVQVSLSPVKNSDKPKS